MVNAWWISLAVAIVGGIAAGFVMFGRHRTAPSPSGAAGNGTAVMPGPGRRAASALLLLILSLGLAGLAAVAIGSVVFLGGLSLTN